MREQVLQNKIIAHLKKMGCFYVKSIVMSKAGCPDILACINGKFVSIECKSDTGKLTALQLHQSNVIKNNGGLFLIATPSNYKEIENLLSNSDMTDDK